MHPSAELYCSKSQKLKGKKIVLGVTGSIAAVETVKLIRELIRHGAEVIPVMSHEARKILHPYALEFASGNKVITEITGEVEHVSYCGEVRDKADLLLIAPCTANTISKIAKGIDDTPVTTFATTALGSKIPLMIAPGMHTSMFSYTIIKENIEKLKGIGVEFIEPRLEENKAKMCPVDEITARVIRKIWRRDFEGKSVLIIAGSTFEEIDDVRYITNKSSGRTGIELARNAFERGAKVKLLYGLGTEKVPSFIPFENFSSVSDLKSKLEKLDYFAIIVCAAISDYTVDKRKGKICSERDLRLTLKPAEKIVRHLRSNFKGTLVAFKLESNISKKTLIERAYNFMVENKLDIIIANDIRDVKADESTVFIIKGEREIVKVEGAKNMIAERILDAINATTSRDK